MVSRPTAKRGRASSTSLVEPPSKRPTLASKKPALGREYSRLIRSDSPAPDSKVRIDFTHIDGPQRPSGSDIVRSLNPFGHKGRHQEYKEEGGEWKWVEIRLDTDGHYVDLKPASVTALENYMREDSADFGKLFVTSESPADILQDLRSNLPGAPIFHHHHTLGIIQAIYNELQYGASLNDELFRLAVSLIAHHLHEHSKPDSGSPKNAVWDIELDEKHLRQLICSPDAVTECNDDTVLYSHALSFAMMVEGALGAARLMEADIEKHWKKVTWAIKISFGVVKAAVGCAPLVGGLAVLFDPFQDAVLQHEAHELDKKKVIVATINRFVTRTCAKAMEGVFNFGTGIEDRNYRVVGSLSTEKDRSMRKQRGKKFVEFVGTIRNLV